MIVAIAMLLSLWHAAAQGVTTPGAMKGDESAANKRDMGTDRTNHGRTDYAPVTTRDSVSSVINHPAFEGFGQHILPGGARDVDRAMLLNDIGALLPYHGHIAPATTVRVINHMIGDVSAGRTIFYDFYTDEQRRRDPAKETTGLFFFRGEPNAPFAVVCPGGGFSYVGSIHEGFPYALELSLKGYNGFVLQYRVGAESKATEDLAAALSWIFHNAKELQVGTEDYSLWGSSAGARMAANVGSRGTGAFGGDPLPGPCTVVMAYTGHTATSRTDPPTFVVVSADDRIVNVPAVERRVQALGAAGIDVEYRKYRYAGHGFGLGTGTDAEGWLEHAVRFWKLHMSRSGR
jgi:acetyl esterase/lipase